MRNTCITILSADDSVNQIGTKFDANQLVSASFIASFGDATAAGTVKIQVSNDPPVGSSNLVKDFTPTNWVDSGQSATITSGTSAALLIPNMSYRWLRAVWTNSSGGSTLITVNMNALSI